MVKVNNKTIITTGLLAILLFNNISVAFALVGNSTINSMSGVDSVTHNAATQTTNITTNNAVNTSTINWQTLNVGKTETLDVNFTRGSQTLLNNVVSGMTTVAGQILSTGIGADSSRIIISNPNGILLDKGSYINANALMLTTLGVDVQNSLIQLSQKNGSVAAPNTGIVIKGKIDTNDLAVVSRGIVLDGADIFANGNVSLVTAEGATFQMKSKGTSTLKNIVSISDADRSKVTLAPYNTKYAEDVKSFDNILIKSNAAIKSANGKIYLGDYRTNNGGVNIASSTLIAKKGINIDSTNYTKIATLNSDENTSLNIKAVINPYNNNGAVDISGINAIKGVSVQNASAQGNSAILTSVNAQKGGIAIDGYKKVNINSSESGNTVSVKNAGEINLNGLKNDFKTSLQSTGSTYISNSFLRTLNTEANKLFVSNSQLYNFSAKANNTDSLINLTNVYGYSDKKNTINVTSKGDFSSAYIKANSGTSVKVGNINTADNITISAYDITQIANSKLNSTKGFVAITAENKLTTSNINALGNLYIKGKNITGNNKGLLKSENGTVSLTATENLTHSNIDSLGTVYLNGQNITSAKATTVKSTNGNIYLNSKNNIDTSKGTFISDKGDIQFSAINNLKTADISAFRNIILNSKNISTKTDSYIKSSNGSITLKALNNLNAYNLEAAENISLTGSNSAITANVSTPKDVTISSTYKSNIHSNNVKANKVTLLGSSATPDVTSSQKEANNLAKAEARRLAKIEADRLATEKAAADKAEADRLATEKAAADKAEADRLATEKAAADKAEADRLATEKAAADKAEADRLATEKTAADKAEADRLATEKTAADKAEADRLATEKTDQTAQTAQTASNTKAQKIDTKMSDSSLPSQLALNVKSLAANEEVTSVKRLIKNTAKGFVVLKKITI